MVGMMGNMTGSMMAVMGLSLGFGIALGLAALAGTFYLIWRFVRAIETRNKS
ncbi:PGF-CTERM sorting domain-containing protein [Ammoniphilus sp. 3BR4]|uniref:PGF-CTERM sorting domain-containing protein n=1 Tax=Ammoniphilus sp. 3BR4 TaxID=3158265 RepID=UPI0034656674